MSCSRKRINPFIQPFVLFVILLIPLPIYANALGDLINNTSGNESQLCTKIECFFPGNSLASNDIIIDSQINWNDDKNLVLHTKGNVIFKRGGKIVSKKNGSIILKSGMEPGERVKYDNTVTFEDDSTQIEVLGKGEVRIYYNPNIGDEKHKYHNPSHDFYEERIKADILNTYMLVNNVNDLQDIILFLSGDYALSQDVNAAETRNWDEGKGFKPLKNESKDMPFSGNFDGNNYSIRRLFINRSEEDVGLFGKCGKRDNLHNVIENIILENFDITGTRFVGSLAGFAAHSDLLNINIVSPKIEGRAVVGGLIGTTDRVQANAIQITDDAKITSFGNTGFVIGGAGKGKINLLFKTKQDRDKVLGMYKILGNQDNQTQICLSSKDTQMEICLLNSDTTTEEASKLMNQTDLNKIYSLKSEAEPKKVIYMVNQDEPQKLYLLTNQENLEQVKQNAIFTERLFLFCSRDKNN